MAGKIHSGWTSAGETALAYVEKLAEIGVDEVICLIQMGTVPQNACLETIRQWGEHVIPRLRWEPTRSAGPST